MKNDEGNDDGLPLMGYAAGMSFPFPHRKVRLLRDPDAGEDSSVLKGEKT